MDVLVGSRPGVVLALQLLFRGCFLDGGGVAVDLGADRLDQAEVGFVTRVASVGFGAELVGGGVTVEVDGSTTSATTTTTGLV